MRCTPGRICCGTAATPGAGGGVGGPGQVVEVGALGLGQPQGPRQRLEHGLGDAAEVAALQPRVVLHAEPGEHRELLAAQPGDPPQPAVDGQAGLAGGDPAAAGDEEVAHLGTQLGWRPRRRG